MDTYITPPDIVQTQSFGEIIYPPARNRYGKVLQVFDIALHLQPLPRSLYRSGKLSGYALRISAAVFPAVQGPGRAPRWTAKSRGRDGTVTRSPSWAVKVQDGRPWTGQRALQDEKCVLGQEGDCRG